MSRSRSFFCLYPGYFSLFSLLAFLGLHLVQLAADPVQMLPVGIASVDITPGYPVRLNGYGLRRTESEGVTHPIYAKALAFAGGQQGPALLITTDNLCVPDAITKNVAERLAKSINLKLERLTITATHTHTAPMLVDVAPTIFGTNIPPEHWAHIEQYTREFTDKLIQVAEAAIKDIQPAQLAWGVGEARFAINRRTPGGPVDHDLSALFVRTPQGQVRAVYFSYPCHCVTFSHNKISGDWAGYAQESIEKLFPGAIALASVGCGADSNPNARGSPTNLAPAIQQGQEIADSVWQLATQNLHSITSGPDIRYHRVDLPLDTPRTQKEWEQRAHSDQYAIAYHARLNLERLARGEKLPTSLNYPLQTWLFGDQLAMVFLPGETVVDYSLRLKREFDRSRLWVNGYSNDGRCYIPSERVLSEGGYEGGEAMIYYDRPQRFAPGVEQRIFNLLYDQLPKSFASSSATEGVSALRPSDSLRAIHLRPGLEIELVAAEPLISGPVAIDWGADRRLWVCEMNDYPAGLDGNYQPGGRVKFLEDTDGDGIYDKATLFADNLPFPTGVTAWGRGVLICAAPDILYAEDTDGDGKADRIEKVFTGFYTDNFQARVNSLQLGLDNWIYGANGLLGGTITPLPRNFPTFDRPSSGPVQNVSIRNHDFRFSPVNAAFETVTGLTQQGRVRDDWGNWFGCNNSELLLSFGLPELYTRRNPSVEPPPQIRNLTTRPEGSRVFPRSRTLQRFGHEEQANHATSACGLALYRDFLLGEEFYGNAFTCEPVHNLVHREVLSEADGAFSSARAPDEDNSEFLSSTDNWFRPVQARTGPDGALYVVDMYRFLIEHPRWIPASRLAKIDPRAGSGLGRIYRVRPKSGKLRDLPDLTRLGSADLANALNTPNGTARDLIHAELIIRQDSAAIPPLTSLLRSAELSQVRLQSLCVLEGLRKINLELLLLALADRDPHVRREAIRISEPLLQLGPDTKLSRALLSLRDDRTALVQEQLALSLGEWKDPQAGEALARLALETGPDSPIHAAVLTSAKEHALALLDAIQALPQNDPRRSSWIRPLVATAAESENEELLVHATSLAIGSQDFEVYAALLDSLDRRNSTVAQFIGAHPSQRTFETDLDQVLARARTVALDPNMPDERRESALHIMQRKGQSLEDTDAVASLIATDPSGSIRTAALNALRRQTNSAVADTLLGLWPKMPLEARASVVSLLLSRDAWVTQLLSAVRRAQILPPEISLAAQQTILRSANPAIRQPAQSLFQKPPDTSRAAVLENYKNIADRSGSAGKGRELFSANCATCHRVNGVGFEVGPNLSALRDKEPDYWVKNILDPNAVIEPRFVTYQLELTDDESLTGLLKSESGNAILLLQPGGITESISRGRIKNIRPSKLSLMPEGFEMAIPPDRMADLIAFLKQASEPGRGDPDTVLRDPVSVARLVLDRSQTDQIRETAISSNPQFASDLIAIMTQDLPPGNSEENLRIPWLWRIALAAGKRNDEGQINRILEIALPAENEPLRDWQAVVLGAGLAEGLTSRHTSPQERLSAVLADHSKLRSRWNHLLQLTSARSDATLQNLGAAQLHAAQNVK